MTNNIETAEDLKAVVSQIAKLDDQIAVLQIQKDALCREIGKAFEKGDLKLSARNYVRLESGEVLEVEIDEELGLVRNVKPPIYRAFYF